MERNFEQKFEQYIKEENLLTKGDVIVVGLSGGADSVSLLTLFKELSSEWKLNLIAAHVNHGMRETAKRDEDYVRKLCEELKVPLKVKNVDVRALAKENGESIEEAGRNIRYAFFREVLQEAGCKGEIAVAHHKDDNCETILFNFIRGSALNGLTGMKPISENGEIVRPLLWADREEIEAFLSEKKIPWMTDETNADTSYSRNLIRHELMPLLSELSPAAKEHITATADYLAETEDLLREQTDMCILKYVQEIPEGLRIEETLLEVHPCLVGRVLYHCLTEVAGRKKDISRVQVRELRDLFSHQVGRKREFLYGLYATRTYGGVELIKGRREAKGRASFIPKELPMEEEDALLSGIESEIDDGFALKMRLIFYTPDKIIPNKTYTKWFDYDKINSCLNVRTADSEDYLVINKEGNRKSLKDYYKNEKIPSGEREGIPVIAEGNHILWVIGHRMSQYYQVDEHTTRILEIQVGGKDE